MWCLPSVVGVSEASSSSEESPLAAPASLSGGSVSKQRNGMHMNMDAMMRHEVQMQ